MKKITSDQAAELTNGLVRKYGKNSKIVEFIVKMKPGEFAYVPKEEVVGKSNLSTCLHHYKNKFGLNIRTKETADGKGYVVSKR